MLFFLIISKSTFALGVLDNLAACGACTQKEPVGVPKVDANLTKATLAEAEQIITPARSVANTDSNIEDLSVNICLAMSGDPGEITTNIDYEVRKHLKNNYGKTNPSKKEMVKFLNKQKNNMTCEHNDKNLNYMMVALQMWSSTEGLFIDYFLNLIFDEEELIDVNAISYSGPNGEAETVLDFMERRKSEVTLAFKDEIEELIVVFKENLGAKKYSELNKEEKQQ